MLVRPGSVCRKTGPGNRLGPSALKCDNLSSEDVPSTCLPSPSAVMSSPMATFYSQPTRTPVPQGAVCVRFRVFENGCFVAGLRIVAGLRASEGRGAAAERRAGGRAWAGVWVPVPRLRLHTVRAAGCARDGRPTDPCRGCSGVPCGVVSSTAHGACGCPCTGRAATDPCCGWLGVPRGVVCTTAHGASTVSALCTLCAARHPWHVLGRALRRAVGGPTVPAAAAPGDAAAGVWAAVLRRPISMYVTCPPQRLASREGKVGCCGAHACGGCRDSHVPLPLQLCGGGAGGRILDHWRGPDDGCMCVRHRVRPRWVVRGRA